MKNNRLVVYGVLFIIFFGGFLFTVRAQAQFRAQFPSETSCDTDPYWEIMRLDTQIEHLYHDAFQESHKALMSSLNREGMDTVYDHAQRSLDKYEEVERLTKKKVELLKNIVHPKGEPGQTALR